MKKNKLSLLKNTLALYIMNIVKLVFPLLTLPYLTRVLSTDAYGAVTYVKSFIAYVQLILDFGFLLSATKRVALVNDDLKQVGRILGDTIIEKIILGLFATFFYSIALAVVPVMKQYAFFAILYFCSSIISIFIFDFLYCGIEKMILVALPYTVAKSITTILTFVLIHGDNNLILIPILEIIGNCISAIFSLIFIRKMKILITFSGIKQWFSDLKDSGIYFLSNFATTVFGALTTIIAGFYLSLTDIACWGLCFQILSAAKALYNPITNSLYPYMIRGKDLSIVKKINIIMIIPIFLGCCIVLFGAENVLFIVGGEKYTVAATALKILLPAFVFSFYSMLYGWPVLGAIGKIKETTLSTIMASSIQIFCLAILVILDKFSLSGIAISCSISETMLFIIRYIIYKKNKNLFI